MVHDWCYSIDVYDSQHNRASVREIEDRLRQIVGDVEERIRSGKLAVPVGVLSSDGRNQWAQVCL
jgi:hypothetical protein